MRWTDQAIILHKKSLGERDFLVTLFTLEHGLHKGYVKNIGRSKQATMQVGALVQCTWNARLEEQLGQFNLEILYSDTSYYQHESILYCLNAIVHLLVTLLPERMPQPSLYKALLHFLRYINNDNYIAQYSILELCLLEQQGFGLDLTSCALGGHDVLSFVSPKTGRACSYSKGYELRDKLLPLPAFLLENIYDMHHDTSLSQAKQAFMISSHFLYKHLLEKNHIACPMARQNLTHYINDITQ